MKGIWMLMALSTGCIIAGGGDGKRGDWEDDDSETYEDWDGEAEAEETDDSQTEEAEAEPVPAGGLYLTPDKAPPGAVFMTSIRSDYPLDWATIVDVEAYGDIEICATQALYDQMLLTISIDRDVPEAAVDFVIEYSSGDIDFIEDGLRIDYEADIGSAEVGPGACN